MIILDAIIFFLILMPDLVYEQHDCQFANLLAKNELTKKLEFQIDSLFVYEIDLKIC